MGPLKISPLRHTHTHTQKKRIIKIIALKKQAWNTSMYAYMRTYIYVYIYVYVYSESENSLKYQRFNSIKDQAES